MNARSLNLRRTYWFSALGHASVLSGLMAFSGWHPSRLLVGGVEIVFPPPGTGPGNVEPKGTERSALTPERQDETSPEPPEEQRRPQPERNIVKEPSPDGLAPPPKDDVPSLRPDARDPSPPAAPSTTAQAPGRGAPGKESGKEAGPAGAAAGLGTGTGIGVEGGVLGAHAPWYLVQLRDKIAANWRPPAAIGRTGPAQASFHFRVGADGGVSHVEPIDSSRSFQYDIAARRAIEMASPLPPLPEELGTGSIGITLTFTQVY